MNVWKLTLNFFLIIFLQVALFNQFLFEGFMNPYVYVLFIILLPTSISRANILLIAFALGLCIDFFENSAGVHAAASVFLAYLRPVFFKVLSRRMEETRQDITIKDLGFLPLSLYAIMAVFIHHFALFLIESFSVVELGTVLVRTLLSTIFTFIFVVMYQLWNYRKRRL